MAIKCRQCGHDYDVTLFQFGHTVQCDCGAVVAMQGGAADGAQPLKARRKWSRRRKILTGCGTFLALLLIVLLGGALWLYCKLDLDEPEPRAVDHFLCDDVDGFIAVNVSAGDAAIREFMLEILKMARVNVSASQLPEPLAAEVAPGDTVLDLPGVLPARFAVFYRFRKEETGDEAYCVASPPELPLIYCAGGAVYIRRLGEKMAASDPLALWDCDGVPVLRLQQVSRRRRLVTGNAWINETVETNTHVALLNRTLFVSPDREGIRVGIARFRSAAPDGPNGRLKAICDRLDFSSDVVAAARKEDGEIRRLLRMTENTPADELPPDECMLVKYGVDPDMMLAVGVQVDFETAEKVVCKGFILCPDAATAGTFDGLLTEFLPWLGSPHAVFKVTRTRVTGSIVEVEFTVEGLLTLIRAKVASFRR